MNSNDNNNDQNTIPVNLNENSWFPAGSSLMRNNMTTESKITETTSGKDISMQTAIPHTLPLNQVNQSSLTTDNVSSNNIPNPIEKAFGIVEDYIRHTNQSNTNNQPMSINSPQMKRTATSPQQEKIQQDTYYSKKRATRACESCRKRKIKCDPVDPITNKCSNCTKFHMICVFDNRKRKATNANTNSNKLLKTMNPKSHESEDDQDDIEDHLHGNCQPLNTNDSSININLLHETKNEIDSLDQSNDRVLKIDRKVTMLYDQMAKMVWMMDKILSNNISNSNSNNSKLLDHGHFPVFKIYKTIIFSPSKIKWIKTQLSTPLAINNEDFILPIYKMSNISWKYSMIRSKKLMNFSSPTLIDNIPQLYPLPMKRTSEKLLKYGHPCFSSSITSIPIVEYDNVMTILNKYYDTRTSESTVPQETSPNHTNLSCSELFLLNITICLGASAVNMNSNNPTEDKFLNLNLTSSEIKCIENLSLLNSIYYCNKLAISTISNSTSVSNLITVQSLILLSHYLQISTNIELSSNILSIAIRYAIDLGLHLIDYYKDLDVNKSMQLLGLWWHLYSKDKLFSLILNRPPIIKKLDIQCLDDESFLNIIKKALIEKFKSNTIEINKMSDVKIGLNKISNYYDYFPLVLSYYTLQLSTISEEIFNTCFAINSMKLNSFDEILQKVNAINEKLLNWEYSLPPCLKIKSYKNYMTMLFSQNTVIFPPFHLDMVCSRILKCNYQLLYLKNVLSMFTLSFLIDNEDLFRKSSICIPRIYQQFINQNKDSSIKMLELLKCFDIKIHMWDELWYYFLTGVFTLSFYIIKNINGESSELPYLIKLLQNGHELFMADKSNIYLSSSIKWNVDTFFYTFILHHILNYVKFKYPNNDDFKFHDRPYEQIYSDIIKKTNRMKNIELNELICVLQNHKDHSPNTATSTTDDIANASINNDVHSPTLTLGIEISTPANEFDFNGLLKPLSTDFSSGLNLDSLIQLKTSDFMATWSELDEDSTPPLSYDSSLFPIEPINFSVNHTIFAGCEEEVTYTKKVHDINMILSSDDQSSDLNKFSIASDPFWVSYNKYFPKGNFFYDRDLFFANYDAYI
ncbi:hypothetical protein TBLA_0F01200 [Henningerozyma blattae CBS 6284]|uniref:Zn(2)-C6 fungal-type domain-containing protein n=1 Tax=Henningerozyma blattae (strain ATCC 34711 / CBS 6284 / DSM 70876 / NBRC 10599 / NRRL Y-10934 / UCD 77-7) TaxID=1071380 RepID=I2H5L1_HENB6|nr:hypothetical protein TBLA_0F01200 [Tetrapisispora blattae CBS 6284]CCH61663.1 hypothetical protein TBLA_0F01200 [Tetrapisispora blattae CBS 6284]